MLFRCYNYFQRALKGFFVIKKDASDQAAIKVLQSCLEKIPFLQVESIQQADSPGNLRLGLRPAGGRRRVRAGGQPGDCEGLFRGSEGKMEQMKRFFLITLCITLFCV